MGLLVFGSRGDSTTLFELKVAFVLGSSTPNVTCHKMNTSFWKRHLTQGGTYHHRVVALRSTGTRSSFNNNETEEELRVSL